MRIKTVPRGKHEVAHIRIVLTKKLMPIFYGAEIVLHFNSELLFLSVPNKMH